MTGTNISNLTIALVVVGAFMACMGLFASSIFIGFDKANTENYAANYDQSSELSLQAESIINSTAGIGAGEDPTDKEGGLISSAVSTAKYTASTTVVFKNMMGSLAQSLNLGSTGTILKAMAVSVVVFIVFFGLLMYFRGVSIF